MKLSVTLLFAAITLLYVAHPTLAASDDEGWSWGGDDNDDDPPNPKPTTKPTTVTPTASSKRPSKPTPPNPGRYENCVKQCPRTPQHNPVCGTDSITYKNEGMLKCAKHCGTDVRVLHEGKCEEAPGPSTAKPSTPNPSSRVDRCIKDCPKLPQYNPVCGTDGVSYNNDALLSCAKNCGKSVEIEYRGKCAVPDAPSSDIPPTSTRPPPTDKPNPTEEPSDLDDIVFKECLQGCPATLEFKPVCGSDGKQYANMRVFNCQVKCGRKIEVTSQGKCPSDGGSSGSTAMPNPRQEACIKKCPKLQQYNPICGTDNQTYKNEGAFKCAKNCGVAVEMSFMGKC